MAALEGGWQLLQLPKPAIALPYLGGRTASSSKVLGCRGLGFRVLGFWVSGFRVLGFWGFKGLRF